MNDSNDLIRNEPASLPTEPDTSLQEDLSPSPQGRQTALLTESPNKSRIRNLRHERVSWASFLLVQGAVIFPIILIIAWFIRPAALKTTASSVPVAAPIPPDSSAIENGLQEATARLTSLQKQLEAERQERQQTQAKLQEMADRMALVIKQTSFSPGSEAGPSLGASDASQVAAMMPSVSPSTSELILLKERNRLSEYADKAIALGTRDDLQAIVDAMFDPGMKHLNHACQAEFRRVQNYYEYSVSIDPGYTLPVQELFKDTQARAEADLTPAQLTGLLQDHQQPWENRLRAAYLLRASTDKDTNQVLLKALREDPSLDVAKQAQTSFEKRVARKFRLFDIPTIEAWWESQKTK